jgi:hypothetical protein
MKNRNIMFATVPRCWEIRQGVSSGNPGTLIASGFTYTPTVTATGRFFNNIEDFYEEFRVMAPSCAQPFPSAGHFWLNVTPIGDGQGKNPDAALNSATSGADCVGTPC